MRNATSPAIVILIEANQRRSRLRQIARALMLSFGISDGYELVCHLTSSPCRTNHEALVLWIQDQCLEISTDFGPHTMAALTMLLRNKLDSIRVDDQDF